MALTSSLPENQLIKSMKIMHKLAFLLTLSLLCLSSLQAATWTVNTSLDNNLGSTTNRTGSLRFCIDNAASGDDIVFDPITDGNPIILSLGILSIVNKDIELLGNGRDLTVVDGNNLQGILEVNSSIATASHNFTIQALTVRNGRSSSGAGGISTLGINVIFNNIRIHNCMGPSGGGMRFQSDKDVSFSINNSLFDQNSTGDFGGGVNIDFFQQYQPNINAIFTQSTFLSNNARRSGGIYSFGFNNTLQLDRCTVSGNVADFGGGVESIGGQLTILSSTITRNKSVLSVSFFPNAAGVGFFGSGGSILTIQNSIVANNDGPAVNDLDLNTGIFTSLGHNLIGDHTGVVSFLNTDQTGSIQNPLDPELTPLGNYGGSNPTHLPLCSSPALNMGDPSIVGLDQRGQPRTGTINGGQPDIGATEFQWPVFDGAALQKVCKGTCNRVEIVPSADLGYWSGISTSFSTSLFGHVPNPTGIYSACVPVSNQDLTVFFNMMDQNGCQFQSELDFQVKPKCDGFMDICCNFGGNGNSSNKVFNIGELSLIAYPNPSTDGIVRLKLDGEFDLEAFTENSMQLQALDIDGQIALEITVTTQELKSGTAILDVSNLPKGLYHLHLVNDQISGEVSTKIIW